MDKASEKFKLTYSGKPSLFEARISPPKDVDEVKVQIIAADQAGNFGQHTLSFQIIP